MSQIPLSATVKIKLINKRRANNLSEREGASLFYVAVFIHAQLRALACNNNIVSSLPRIAATMRSIFRTLCRGCDSISGKLRIRSDAPFVQSLRTSA